MLNVAISPIFTIVSLLFFFVTPLLAKTKNPKRVAAGKKAWATRMRGRGRRAYSRAKSYRRKPVQRGLGGRIGAFILGAAPTIIAGVGAFAEASRLYKKANLNIMGAGLHGLFTFINNITNGFLGVEAFKDVQYPTKDGNVYATRISANVPKGSLLITSGAGLFMMLEDWVASKLAGGRPVKIPLTNYNAIGGS